VEDSAAINFLDESAPPVLTMYDDFRRDAPVHGEKPEDIIHHPKFGFDLKRRMDALGVECTVVVEDDLPAEEPDKTQAIQTMVADFLCRHLS